MIVVGIVLIAAVLGVGNLYLHLHTLPERMAHKSQKLQFEIVAVLGLLALFTHVQPTSPEPPNAPGTGLQSPDGNWSWPSPSCSSNSRPGESLPPALQRQRER